MILSALLGALVLAPFLAEAQTNCNGIPCVTGATCTNPNGAANARCTCDSGNAGNGRTHCEANQCICSTIADPHAFLFDSNQEVTSNLPCTVFFSNFFDSTCNVQTFVDTETRGTGTGANFRVFTRQIRATINSFTNGLIATVTIDASGPTVTGSTSLITTSTADGFSVAEAANCNTKMGYNDTYGSAYLSLPNTGISYQQFCGDCDGTADENPGSTAESQLDYYLQFLAPAAQQDSGSYNTQCGNIQSAISGCTAANRAIAANVCIPHIDTFGTCLLANNDVADYGVLLTNFASCVTSACAGDVTTPCTLLASLDTASTSCSLTTPTSCP